MQEQVDQARVFEPPQAHPTITYFPPSSLFSSQELAHKFIELQQPQYQITSQSIRSAPPPHDKLNSKSVRTLDPVLDQHNLSTSPTTHSLNISASVIPPPPHPSEDCQQLTITHQEKPLQQSEPVVGSISIIPQTTRIRGSVSKSPVVMGSGTVKRSISTPNVHQVAAMHSSAAMGIQFSTDKRRNKLGYHRTSVACGHCRKRKIRCLLAKDDHQGRCVNCIRLKKDCNFFPVETTERRPRSLSKPDISAIEDSSSASSPSPGLALGNLSRIQASSGYAASVPSTPTYDFHHGILEDGIRNNSVSSATGGRLSISQSNFASRRPSLSPLAPALKQDPDYLPSPSNESPSFPRAHGIRMNLVSEHSPSQADQVGLDSAFWRLASSPMAPSQYSIYSQHANLGSMSSLHSTGNSDTQEDAIWPSRVNSIDHGLTSNFAFPAYSADLDYNPGLPGMYNNSASASTASLTASIQEPLQYEDSGISGQLYTSPWNDAPPLHTNLHGNDATKEESYEAYYGPDARYQIIEDSSLIFPSPFQSPKFVPQI